MTPPDDLSVFGLPVVLDPNVPENTVVLVRDASQPAKGMTLCRLNMNEPAEPDPRLGDVRADLLDLSMPPRLKMRALGYVELMRVAGGAVDLIEAYARAVGWSEGVTDAYPVHAAEMVECARLFDAACRQAGAALRAADA